MASKLSSTTCTVSFNPTLSFLENKKTAPPDILTDEMVPKVLDSNREDLNFKGIDFRDKISSHSICALIDRFPDLETVTIWGNSDLSYEGTIHLRQLLKVKKLCLGKLKGITANMIQLMFSHNAQVNTWQELEELDLVEIPIGDDSLNFISLLPKLKSVIFEECDRITVQGLRHLMKGCPSLEGLTIATCPAIDPFALQEFSRLRPQVKIQHNTQIDLSAVAIAQQEAQFVMEDSDIAKDFIFFSQLNLKQPSLESDCQAINKFYEERLGQLELSFEIEEHMDVEKQWMKADQILQAYINVSRSAWAIRKELYRIGFFVEVTKDLVPQTVGELEAVIKERDYDGLFSFRRKVRFFDFEGLGLTHFPLYLLEDGEWEQVEQIKLAGNYLEAPPKNIKNFCPKLSF